MKKHEIIQAIAWLNHNFPNEKRSHRDIRNAAVMCRIRPCPASTYPPQPKERT